jgi:hypothetical protein
MCQPIFIIQSLSAKLKRAGRSSKSITKATNNANAVTIPKFWFGEKLENAKSENETDKIMVVNRIAFPA